MIVRYGLDKADAGSLLSLMSLGILAASLVFGPIVDRFGYRPVLVAGALGVGLGLAAIAWAPTASVLAPAMLVFGFGGGLLNGATNALVADITPEGRGSGLAFLGVFFGIGAFGVPLVLGLLLRMGDVHGDRGRAGAAGGRAAGGLPGRAVPAAEAAAGVPAAARRGAARRRHVAAGGPAAVLPERHGDHARRLECPVRARGAGADEERSMLVLSLFWVGMLAARLVLTRLLRSRPATTVFPGFLAVALVGAGLLLAVPSPVAAGAGSSCWGSGWPRDSRSCSGFSAGSTAT